MTWQPQTKITQTGAYSDVPEAAYHADPVRDGSLSSSMARKMIDCPARAQHEMRNPSAPTPAMELGTAVHRLVLEGGRGVVVTAHENWRSKGAREDRDAIRAANAIPLSAPDAELAYAMRNAIIDCPLAMGVFAHGRPEQTLVWWDEETEVGCRARLDWMPTVRPEDPGPLWIGDLKTTRAGGAHPRELARSMAVYGYHQQAAWYIDGLAAVLPTLETEFPDDSIRPRREIRFVLVAVESAPPHLVSVAQISAEAIALGRALNRRALEVWVDCRATGEWPGYAMDLAVLDLPMWATRHAEAMGIEMKWSEI